MKPFSEQSWGNPSGPLPIEVLGVLGRYDLLRSRAVLRLLANYPVTMTIAVPSVVAAIVIAKARIEPLFGVVAFGWAAPLLGLYVGWLTSSATATRWLPALVDGPLAKLVLAGVVAKAAVTLRTSVLSTLPLPFVLIALSAPERPMHHLAAGYIGGGLLGAALGLSWAWLSTVMVGSRTLPTSPTGARWKSGLTPGLAFIVVHLRGPGRSWAIGITALALWLLGVAVGRADSREGVAVGHFGWLCVQSLCGLLILSPNPPLLRTLAPRPMGLGILYLRIMGSRIFLHMALSLVSATIISSTLGTALVLAAGAAVLPLTLGSLQFLLHLAHDRTAANFRLALVIGASIALIASVGPLAAVLMPALLWWLWRQAERLRWGRL